MEVCHKNKCQIMPIKDRLYFAHINIHSINSHTLTEIKYFLRITLNGEQFQVERLVK